MGPDQIRPVIATWRTRVESRFDDLCSTGVAFDTTFWHMTSDIPMIPLEVRDFVTRGWATNIDLYHAQAPEAAGAMCNASHARGDEINPIARRTQMGKRLSFDSFIFKDFLRAVNRWSLLIVYGSDGGDVTKKYYEWMNQSSIESAVKDLMILIQRHAKCEDGEVFSFCIFSRSVFENNQYNNQSWIPYFAHECY